MKLRLFTAVVACFALAANAAELTTEKLPVRRVVLYKNGVGYFEHTGRIHGDQELKIEFTSAQLNDVLKSLTVLDLNGGKITGVGYNSVAPISEQLKSLRLPLGEDVSLADFLTALRGSHVQMRTGATVVSGRLLGVEQKTIKKGQEESTQLELSVITDAGEISTFPLTPALGLRIADHDLSEEISRYLTLVGSARDQDLRRMTISTSGTGDRNIFVSYVSEVPVWKSTYRILLPTKSDSKPLLQGWAIVDNTVGEDWKNVELSLVAGAPQSFIQDLSRPYYTRRPVVGLPETAMLTPQTHEGTMADKLAPPAPPPAKPGAERLDQLALMAPGVAGGSNVNIITKSGTGSFGLAPGFRGIYGTVVDAQGATINNATITATDENGSRHSAQSDDDGAFQLALNAGRHRIEVESPGFQKRAQTIITSNITSKLVTYRLNVASTSSTVEVNTEDYRAEYGRSSGGIVDFASSTESSGSGANGQDLGDLFEYNLKEKVTILKNHSALVPIINTRIDAEKVTLWNNASGRPLRALWIVNSGDLTLDSGSFNVIENNAFAGEGLLEPLKPKEKRLLSYAIDQGVRVEHNDDVEYRPATHIKVANGMIVQTSERRDHQLYTVRNSDAEAREVIIEHPLRSDWKLAGAMKPEETSASSYRFRVKVPSGQTATLKVDEVQPVENTLALSNVSDEQIKIFFNDRTLTPGLEQALKRIIQQKSQMLSFDQELRNRQTEISTINQDQQRLRENMKALKGSAEEKALLQRYTRELNKQEDKLQAVRGEMAMLELKRAESRQHLDRMLQELALDEDVVSRVN